jgi:transcriptional repressor NrdR
MRCPFCHHEDTQVKDSRSGDDGLSIRRKRFCPKCSARFNTVERMQTRELYVVKKSGIRRPFDREKIFRSIKTAMRKRDFDQGALEILVNKICGEIEAYGDSDIPSTLIGEKIMEQLSKIDHVAYIRFASVYRDFGTVADFEKFIQKMDGCNKNEK